MKCLPQFETCPECVARAVKALPPLEGRARLAAIGLWAGSAAFSVLTAISLWQLVGGTRASTLAIRTAATTLPLVVLATAVFVSMWTHRAVTHALARGAQLDAGSPGGAVVSWYIPIVNLVRPFNIMREMLEHARCDTSLVGVWQGLWVIGGIAANVSGRFQGTMGIAVSIASSVAMIGAGVVGAQVVRSLKWAP
ncbi:MAG: DUF4328 domain-containing protein [Archangium sp.]|nr:DUF4328 domain-containing protein [Archangium sp.]